MPQLILRDIEEEVVRRLKELAGRHGISMEEQHRRLLRESVLGKSKRDFKKALMSMPGGGKDSDFRREKRPERKIAL